MGEPLSGTECLCLNGLSVLSECRCPVAQALNERTDLCECINGLSTRSDCRCERGQRYDPITDTCDCDGKTPYSGCVCDLNSFFFNDQCTSLSNPELYDLVISAPATHAIRDPEGVLTVKLETFSNIVDNLYRWSASIDNFPIRRTLGMARTSTVVIPNSELE